MKNLEFQIYDWVDDHEKEKVSSEESDEGSSNQGTYIIHVFGRTEDDRSVYCKVVDFTPYFYIGLPSSWDKTEAKLKMKPMMKWLTGNRNKKVWWKYKKSLLKMKVVESKKASGGFNNDKKFLFARLVFNNYYAMQKYKRLFEENKLLMAGIYKGGKKFETYEANVLPMIRCFHIQKVSGCSWVQIEDCKLVDDDEKESHCDIETVIKWTELNPIEKDFNAPLRIASFDIECYSIDGQFPQARRKGDQVIQIGTDYMRLGNKESYRQHIVTLKNSDPIPNVVVESYDSERELVLAWLKEVIRSDCDIITGYNIFYFDEKYIYDRAEEWLGIGYELSFLSKLKNYQCRFKENKLASSAMGENLLRYWMTPGRVHIDLMKDVQKTYKLSSYRLDSVSSNFIQGKVSKLKKIKKRTFTLETPTIDDIYKDDYIHLELVNGFVSDYVGEKYKISKVDEEKKIIYIKSDRDLETECAPENGILYWTQAKDDVTAKDIFAMQMQGDKERAIVAKYCVKDCRLVNLLVNKLETVTKNIEMANVCYVPLSYLFVRGQGVKLFSLCLKAFREEGYIFPVIKKPEIDKEPYEGAIVFDPVPTVDYEAYATKDFASLYPSSIMQKNMCHTTIVTDDKYDNLPNVTYYNAKFRESDGSIIYRRFAKKDGLAVVPKILDTLLKERRAVKKKMKVEKDPFRYKILDAKQLALKITANSLYGQLGASTSPVRLRDIAACTCSTGRENLILAKKYDEEIIPGLLNGLRLHWFKDKDKKVKKIVNAEFTNPEDEKLIAQVKKYMMEDLKGIIFQPIVRYGDTDSIFSCYRFREGCEKVKKRNALELWNNILRFGMKLLQPYIPIEYRALWENLCVKYYSSSESLSLPPGPETVEEPDHYNDLLPVEERFKIFLKEYMEESYFPWLWTLQESHLKAFCNFDDKLTKWANHQIEKLRLSPDELEPEDYAMHRKAVKNFIDDNLIGIFMVPVWDFDKQGNKIFKMKFYKGGKSITDKRSLTLSMEMGIITGELVKKRLEFPHDLEYEKTYWPFLILTKKRYVGNKYEFNPDKYKQDCMGIVLKRRDNAPIVKEVCGGIIDRLINQRDPESARKFTIECLEKMFSGGYNINYFLTSKTLKMKESYKDWTRIGHVVLAERIGRRDPGNKPQSGDRITFAAIEKEGKDLLQGDMIETPAFIQENNLKINYLFYMTNQIMKPATQFLNLACRDVKKMFDYYIIKADNEKVGRTDIRNWGKKSKKKLTKKEIKNAVTFDF